MQGGNSWGAGGATAPQLLANNTFFGFSHTTDRKVPSEVVLMGSCRIMNIGGLRGDISVEMMCIC